MARAHQRLDRLLEGTAGLPYPWPHVLGMLEAVAADRSEESEAVLRKAATLAGRVQLHPEAGLPHAMSPEDLIRAFAMQTLGEWSRERHRDVIAQAPRLAESEHVRMMAQTYLAE